MNSDGRHSIKVSSDTLSLLARAGKYGESIDAVLNKVLLHYIKTTKRDTKSGKFIKGGNNE